MTFLNGTVIEIGRKIRVPEAEREGVDTYTSAWGIRAAPAIWLMVLLAAAFTAWLAARYTGAPGTGPALRAPALTAAVLAVLVPLTTLPAIRFLQAHSAARAQSIEKAGFLEAAVATIPARDYRKAISTLEEHIGRAEAGHGSCPLGWCRSCG